MTTREALIARQKPLEAVYPEVREELMKIPGVVGVGLGIKETDGKNTDQIAFRVYVEQKKSPGELPPGQHIPKQIRGFLTDVIVVMRVKEPDITERRNLDHYRPITGGIAVGTEKGGSSYGTLGWFLFYDTPEKSGNVLLSNYHVLFGHDEAADHKVAQPKYRKSCCCECDVVGKLIWGKKDDKVDMAIAWVNDDIDIEFILQNNNAADRITVHGTGTAVVGETVRKIGARSGFTRGVVQDIHAVAVLASPRTGSEGQAINSYTDQIQVNPHPDDDYETEEGVHSFGNHGDSGSMVVNGENNIVGIHFYGTTTDNAGNPLPYRACFSNNIGNILDTFLDNGFDVTVLQSSEGDDSDSAPVAARRGLSVRSTGIAEIDDALRNHPERDRIAGDIFFFRSETLDLVAGNRAVTIAWNRHEGPAFIAALQRSARKSDYQVPSEINGTTLQQLLEAMEVALLTHGSKDLRAFVLQHRKMFLELLNCRNLREWADKIAAYYGNPAPA
jgi:hypothetical protein